MQEVPAATGAEGIGSPYPPPLLLAQTVRRVAGCWTAQAEPARGQVDVTQEVERRKCFLLW